MNFDPGTSYQEHGRDSADLRDPDARVRDAGGRAAASAASGAAAPAAPLATAIASAVVAAGGAVLDGAVTLGLNSANSAKEYKRALRIALLEGLRAMLVDDKNSYLDDCGHKFVQVLNALNTMVFQKKIGSVPRANITAAGSSGSYVDESEEFPAPDSNRRFYRVVLIP